MKLALNCEKISLFGGLQGGATFGCEQVQTVLNRGLARAAVELRPASFLHAAGLTYASFMGGVDFGRINIIAQAMDHVLYILHLRMNVNCFANNSHYY